MLILSIVILCFYLLNVIFSYLYLIVFTDIESTLKELSDTDDSPDNEMSKRAIVRAIFSPKYNIYFSIQFIKWLFNKE